MKRLFTVPALLLASLAGVLTVPAAAQQIKRTPFDVTNYVMDLSLSPIDHMVFDDDGRVTAMRAFWGESDLVVS